MTDFPLPLLQLSIDLWKTTTQNKCNIAECTYMHGRLILPPSPIDSRSLQHHYTKVVLHRVACTYTCVSCTPSNWAQISGKPLHHISFIYSRMHIYPWQINPLPINHRSMLHHYTSLCQSTIDPCYTITPISHIEQNAHIPMTDGSPSINHRSMQDHYTTWVWHTDECTYTQDRWMPHQSIIDPCKTTTPNYFDIAVNAHIPKADGPPSINHRSMQDHYTALVWHSCECTYTEGRWTPPSIDHRSLQDHYTTCVWHTDECTYTQGRWTPQSINHRSMQDHYTKLVWHRDQCTYTQGKWTPQSINHRSMQDHYTKWVWHRDQCT